MSSRLQQKMVKDSKTFNGRTNTITTATSKNSSSTSKQKATDERRFNSGLTTTTQSDLTSSTIGRFSVINDQQDAKKFIEHVDDQNIDEVLALKDPNLIPTSFITELEEDEIYATILEKLHKKFLNDAPKKTNDERKLFSPRLLDFVDHENNENLENDAMNVDDESISTSSNDEQQDFDTDIEPEVVVKEIHDPTGRLKYVEMCEEKKVIPCSYFMAHIQDNELILRYHQFSTQDFQMIAKTLCNNVHIESLHLDGNFLQQQSAKHIGKLLTTNDFITDISLSDNRLGGGRGTLEICRMLTVNQNLKRINLSGNNFNETDIVPLVEAFEKNKILSELDLSRNRFGEESGKIIGNFLSGNYSLETIDLSWNSFRGKSAVELIQGIKENTFLKICNLQMNGLGPESGPAIADCVKQNTTLVELNLSGNRLSTSNALGIAQAFLENKSLKIFKIANNDINSDGILAILFCLKINGSNSIREIDFSQMVVTKDVQQVVKDITQMKNGEFICRTGKELKENVTPNSISECYVKTDLELLKRLGREAGYTAKENQPSSWLTFT